MEFPIIPCNLCGSQENLKRRQIGEMLKQWEAIEPKRLHNIMRSLQNVNPSHLADRRLFDFESLVGSFTPDGENDPLAEIQISGWADDGESAFG